MRWDCYTSKVAHRSARWAASDRGWLREAEECLGHYLDYGEDHYRSPHEYCGPGKCRCRESQPGNIHAYSCVTSRAHYFPSIEEAKAWIEAEAKAVRV